VRLLPSMVVLALGACAAEKSSPPEEKAPPPMKAEEQQRGVQLCEGYVTRLCACAANDPALKDQCELARSQPEALKLPLKMLAGSEGPLNARERLLTETAARKIIAACVKADGALPLDRCPRP